MSTLLLFKLGIVLTKGSFDESLNLKLDVKDSVDLV